MGYAGGRAHVSGHIYHFLFERLYNAFSDHWLWVVVFYALYLMVPLLEQHFHFAWHGFATKSVYMGGTKSQSHGQSVDKTSHILIWLGGCWGEEAVLWVPTLTWLGGSRGCKWLSSEFLPSPSQKGDLPVIHIRIPISHKISPRCWCWVWGVHSALWEQPPGGDPPWAATICHLQDPQGLPAIGVGYSHLGGNHEGSVGGSLPYLGLDGGHLKVPHPLLPYGPSHGQQKGRGPNFNSFFMQSHHFDNLLHCD